MLDEADIKASRLAAPKEAVGRAVLKAVKKDRIQLAVMPGQGRLLRAVMDYLPGPRPALNRAARATTTRRKSSNTAVQRRRRGNLMTASIFTLTSTTSHSQNPCPPATTQAQADPGDHEIDTGVGNRELGEDQERGAQEQEGRPDLADPAYREVGVAMEVEQ